MAKALGGVKKYGKDTPVPLDKILGVCGLDAALWCLRCILEPADREIRLLACDFAEHTISIFEEKYPNNKQPRQIIEISHKFAEGKATQRELDAAWAAVTDAATDAFWADEDAARDAVWAAEDAAWAAVDATEAAAGAAEDAAWVAADAARVAARTAAGVASADAACAAERQWQEQKFREMLNNSGN